jgi:formate hydrogenlyase subunit 3/multisubunit Na+/H+ antiporter MnhD subunit
MFTLSLLYVYIYILIFISLLILSFISLPTYFLTHYSTTSYLVFLQKYTTIKNIFLMLIFSLTGLPPVGLFFIKFNILTFILYQVNFFLIIILFILFFSNMLYYSQLFTTKNYKKHIYNNLNSNVFKVWSNDSINTLNFSSYRHYNFIFLINFILFFIFTVLFVYADLFFIFKLKCQQ